MEVELVGRGLAVVGWGRQGRWRSPRAPGLSPRAPGLSPPEPKFRWRRGQHPDGHLLEGDLEEADLGWVEGNVLLGESSNQTVSWITLSCFGSNVRGTGSSFVLLATVGALFCTSATCGVD